MAQKKYSSSRQSSETIKPNTKLVLVSREPLFYLEFNKPNKQNVYEINSFNKLSFSQSQNNCWHTDWCRECETSKHHFLKSDIKNKHITLISDANVPVRFRAQQRAKYSLLLLKANCIAAQTDFENHRTQRTQIFTVTLTLLSVQNSNRVASRLTTIASFPSVFFQLLQYSRQVFRLTGLVWWQKLTWIIRQFL